MKTTLLIITLIAGMLVGVPAAPASNAPGNNKSAPITVRTVSYPRPPYSGATYFIYEQSGKTICTKLTVCNKFEECAAEYFKGAYRAEDDQDTSEPYGESPPVQIPRAKLNKHVCLRRFKLAT